MSDVRKKIAKALCEGAERVWSELDEEERYWHYRDADVLLEAFPQLAEEVPNFEFKKEE